jgi:hypothetical protein
LADFERLVAQTMAVFEQEQAFVGEVVELERLAPRERMRVGHGKQKRFLEQRFDMQLVVVHGQREDGRVEPAFAQLCEHGFGFSSTSSSSSRGKRSRMRGTTCGSRYGPSVGKMPRRSEPDSGSIVRRAIDLISSISRSTPRARCAISRPTSVSSTLRGVRSTRATPSSSSSFLICVDSVGWLTKLASAAWPKCLCSARATR